MVKRFFIYILSALLFVSILSGCTVKTTEGEASFIGVVLEKHQNAILVAPVEGSEELSSADQIMVLIEEDTRLKAKEKADTISAQDIAVGSRVEIYYDGRIAESYPAQINSSSQVELLEGYVFIASDENFLVKTYIDKLDFEEGEEIKLYSTLEYIGEKDSIEIWSGEPYFHHMIYRDQEVLSGGATLDILQKTEFKKGKIYTLDFSKSGGYSEDDPDADFWKDFFNEEALRLPKGTYTLMGTTNFALDEEEKERVELKTEFIVEVN